MKRLTRLGAELPRGRRSAPHRLYWGGALVAAVLMTACAVEFKNAQPARELAQLSKPPGSVYAGWRVFQDKCAGCHGPAASGTASGPDLLLSLRTMGPRQFVGLVLQRYEWNLPSAQARGDSAAQEALVADVLQRRQGQITMPDWQGEPRVTAHIVDLHAYLSARADGTQGPGRPKP